MKHKLWTVLLIALGLAEVLGLFVFGARAAGDLYGERVLFGDANGDGTVNAADLLLLRRYFADFDYEAGTSATPLGPACTHDFSVTATSPASCTEDGRKTYTCARCGTAYDECLPAVGHDYSTEYTVDVAPTTEAEGSKSRHCTRCDAVTDVTVIPKRSAPDFTFTVNADGVTCTVTGLTGGVPAVLTVPTNIGGRSVTAVGSSAFAGCTGLTSVTLPDGLTKIGYKAFCGCTSLTSVVLPDSVTTLGGDAFCDCTALKSVTLSSSLTRIDPLTFSGCVALTSVQIPDSVSVLGNSAFRSCSSLTSVTLPAGLEKIGFLTFADCTALETFTVPMKMTAWYELDKESDWDQNTSRYVARCTDGDLKKCSYGLDLVKNENDVWILVGLGSCRDTDLIIPSFVEYIGDFDYGHPDFHSVTRLTIPDSVRVIYGGCFMTALPSGDDEYCPDRFTDGVYYEGTVAQWCGIRFDVNDFADGPNPAARTDKFYMNGELIGTDLVIPSGVTTINEYAFLGFDLTSVTIPVSVTRIGAGCFDDGMEITYAGTRAQWRNIDFPGSFLCFNGLSADTPVTCLGE